MNHSDLQLPSTSVETVHTGVAIVHNIPLNEERRIVITVRHWGETGNHRATALLTLNKVLTLFYADILEQFTAALLTGELSFGCQQVKYVPNDDGTDTELTITLSPPPTRQALHPAAEASRIACIVTLLHELLERATTEEIKLPSGASCGALFVTLLPVSVN